MSDHKTPKMKPLPLNEAGEIGASPVKTDAFPQDQSLPSAMPVLSADKVPAGAVLAEWRPRSHGRAGALAAMQMLEALESQRPHLGDRAHIYDGCTNLLDED